MSQNSAVVRTLKPVITLFFLLLFTTGGWGQSDSALVTRVELDSALEQLDKTLGPDDPERAKLLDKYNAVRADLAAIDAYAESLAAFSNARANAGAQAQSIHSSLGERELEIDGADIALGSASLPELEQAIQVQRAELEARQSRLEDFRTTIAEMPGRAIAIRNRLTELGNLIPELESRLALMPPDPVSGSEAEANLWLTQAQLVASSAEKAVLDEELLSQPMRLELFKAQRDQLNNDIGLLDRRLQAMQRRASELRKGAASQAQAEAEMAVASTAGKDPVIQALARRNAELTSAMVKRSAAIEKMRKRATVLDGRADELADGLKVIERKLDLLGLNMSVGRILRERQAQLPNRREIDRESTALAEGITHSSLRQIELEDERRQLASAEGYIDQLLAESKREVSAQQRDDLRALVLARQQLVEQAIQLESTFATNLAQLDFDLKQYAGVVAAYRKFISERLLWIPSRNPLSLFRDGALGEQLASMFDLTRWTRVIGQLPYEFAARPLLALGLALAVAFGLLGGYLRRAVVATGKDVGYVHADLFANSLRGLGLTLLMALRWPLLMLVFAMIFEQQDVEAELASALHMTLLRGAGYLYGLEFLRLLLMPNGLVETHFRWPVRRVATLHRRFLRLEQVFFPAVLLGTFCAVYHARDVGGPLGALSIMLVLLSVSQFFARLPHFLQDKMQMMLADRPSPRSSTLAMILRRLLVWLPLAGVVAVLLGYVYTVAEFLLLFMQTVVLASLMLLLYELGLRWLRITRHRMVARMRREQASSKEDEGDTLLEEELQENDPELLSDEGTKLLNLLTLLGSIGGLVLIWAGVFPALSIFNAVELWHQTVVVEGKEVLQPVTLVNVLSAIAIAVLGWIAVRRVPPLLEILLRQKIGVRPASSYAATRVFQYAATGTLVAMVLSALGGSWSQIQWAVAALSVGIGFGLQEIVANFISGLIILFEQPVRVGDIVTVGEVSGRVTKIRIRATTIRDFDNRELLVPNKEFITQQLLNWSLSDQITRWVMEVGVAYGTDLDKAMGLVSEAVQAHPLVLEDPAPLITFEQFGDSSLVIKARFFLDQLDQRLRVSSAVMLDVNRRFNEAGIVVSFPQRDIHLDTSEPLEIRMTQRKGDSPA
jgi:potassium efflux system protein